MAIELRLNTQKVGNYAFFCPVTRLHLTLTNPIGFVDGVSPYIIRGIKGGSIIDVNNAVKLDEESTTSKLRKRKSKDTKVAEQETVKKQPEAEVIQDQKESESSVVPEAVVEPEPIVEETPVEEVAVEEPIEEKKEEEVIEEKAEEKVEEKVEAKKETKKATTKKTATKRTAKKTS